MLIQWQDRFSTGIAAIDHEHRQLVDLINRIDGDFDAQDRVLTGALLGELLAAISAHFALEERVMQERAYAGYAEHKADHERLLDDIRDIMDDAERGRPETYRSALAPRLDAWFSRHFQTMDAKLHAGTPRS
jgi:hemerythrin-like metal-binding protein